MAKQDNPADLGLTTEGGAGDPGAQTTPPTEPTQTTEGGAGEPVSSNDGDLVELVATASWPGVQAGTTVWQSAKDAQVYIERGWATEPVVDDEA